MLTGDKRNNSRLIRDSLFNDRSDEIFKEHNIKSKWTVKEKMHLQKVLKRIHSRIEEKFGNYRQAFKAFDTNQDGTLSLEEFVSCCELQGIQLPIQDFQGVFGIIDYDGSGEIGYKEFCLLNTDKQNVFAHIETVKKKELEREAEEQKQRLKGKFGHLINLRKSVDNVSNKARSDDQQSLMSSNIGRQSVDISTGESDNMYM
jgi:Ca2+-binding EF-hand superfamily protein